MQTSRSGCSLHNPLKFTFDYPTCDNDVSWFSHFKDKGKSADQAEVVVSLPSREVSLLSAAASKPIEEVHKRQMEGAGMAQSENLVAEMPSQTGDTELLEAAVKSATDTAAAEPLQTSEFVG